MSRRLLASLTLAVSVLACSEPPVKERRQADGALEAARAAGAATYATAELQQAESALAKYDDAVAQHDYRQALNYALEARDRAYAAVSQAANQKAAARSRADALIVELDTVSKTAAGRLSGAVGPRLAGPAADRLRAALRAAPPALQEARTRLSKEDYSGAIAQLTTAIDALRRELGAADSGGRRGRG